MTDPQRLKDEYAGDLQGELLRSVADDAPRRNAHHRTLVALGFGGAALGIPTATTAAAATKVGSVVTFALVAKWLGIGIGAAVVGMGAVYEAPRLMGHGTSSNATPVQQVPVAVPVETVVQSPTPAPVPSSESVLPPTVDNAPLAARHVPRSVQAAAKDTKVDSNSPPTPVEAPEPPGLAHEVAMLDTARQMVSTNPAGTLRALDDYQSQFPHGDLAPEALVLRIEALVRSGQQASANKLASDYLARNPGSPHARKIRALLGAAVGDSP